MRRRLFVMAGIIALTMMTALFGSSAASGAAKQNLGYTGPRVAHSHANPNSPPGQTDPDLIGKNPFDTAETFHYDERAYPARYAPPASQIEAARLQAIRQGAAPADVAWEALGPVNLSGYTTSLIYGNKLAVAGRSTSLAVANTCSSSKCVVYVGTAGGGVWRTLNALSANPKWTALTDDQPSMAVGAITLVPNKRGISKSNPYIVYVGTGEANNAGDNVAGRGVYKIVDDGVNPTVTAVTDNSHFIDRSISKIIVDAADKTGKTMYVATSMGRHGGNAIGGSKLPPNVPDRGVWKTTDGGARWTNIFDTDNPTTFPPAASYPYYFFGSINALEIVGTGNTRAIYAGVEGAGVYRSTDEGATWTAVYTARPVAQQAEVTGDRFDFDFPTNNVKVMYLAVGGPVPDTSFTDGQGFLQVSTNVDSAPPTFTVQPESYGFCGGQCWYDMFVRVDPKHAKTVYIGGTAKYGEPGEGVSLGREVRRSKDSGVTYTDMSSDPNLNNLHPDQHNFAFDRY